MLYFFVLTVLIQSAAHPTALLLCLPLNLGGHAPCLPCPFTLRYFPLAALEHLTSIGLQTVKIWSTKKKKKKKNLSVVPCCTLR
jgi:hypothetical protein